MREQIMQVGGRPLRVAIRPGTGTGPPLLLCNGIGMRLEALQPFALLNPRRCRRLILVATYTGPQTMVPVLLQNSAYGLRAAVGVGGGVEA